LIILASRSSFHRIYGNEERRRSNGKPEEKAAIKAGILATLKLNWKPVVEQQFKTEPDKVRKADVHKNADEIMSNPAVRPITKQYGITLQEIEGILQEIRDEVVGVQLESSELPQDIKEAGSEIGDCPQE
jgi:hypothetical protein